MSHGRRHRASEHKPHGLKRSRLCHSAIYSRKFGSPISELPPPYLPPALDFNVDSFTPSHTQSIDLEKAIVRHVSPYNNARCSISMEEPFATTNIVRAKPADGILPLPPKRYPPTFRHLRYTLFTAYQRLFSLIFILNFIGLVILLRNHTVETLDLNHLATLTAANILIAILIRQEFCVNFMFRSAWYVSWRVPLRMRRIIARVYTYGGIHSGAALAGTLWFLTFTTILTINFIRHHSYTAPILVLTWHIVITLAGICLLSLPTFRSRHHNTFEITHRIIGWISILLFWSQILLITHHTSQTPNSPPFLRVLLRTPSFWLLSLTSLLLLLPWLRLRRWTFQAEYLSPHALRLHFQHPVPRFSCLSVSSSPLCEWHPFATFPSTLPSAQHPSTSPPTSSMVISDAGDWTHALLSQTSTPAITPLRLWVKGTTKAGVLSLSCMFPRVVIVTTGSGIGPALSSLVDRPTGQTARLVWSTRDPLATFGAAMLGEIERADPEAVVVDTTAVGRPDLVVTAWRVYREIRAEAVFVLSNGDVTKKIVYGLEARGVPAFGPIWDS